ncbi:MAG: MotA/TolQ/ExbB proton channel family protein [Candidatus Eisenbacteria bacterium]|nr:MotA/TolQ/ExbB proton channel family protein [Candidatus Eisenbacteria bacterium]
MKQRIFMIAVYVGAFAIATVIFMQLPEYVKKGGPLVVLLIALSIISVAYMFERSFTLRKARGKGPLPPFLSRLRGLLDKGELAKASALCSEQKGSCANVLKAGLDKFGLLIPEKLTKDKHLSETQRAMEEANMLEVPLLERNLIALSTIASIGTMVGLLGTTIGMIRAFRAMAHAGAPDAIQLAQGISEALINTAGGLFIAIAAIVAYNYFVTKVDNFNYMMDEASYEVVQLLSSREGEKNASA